VAGGGCGGVGGGRKYIQGNIFGEESNFRISRSGEVERTIEVTSEDERLTMTIPEGTIAKGEDDERLESLEMTTDENPPPPPEDAHVIGLAYSFGPAGATFDPPITLEFTYDPDTIPEGVNEENLVVAYYDEDAEEWVELECTVDPETHTITACVAHFTTFALIGNEEEEPLSEPAVFTFSSLTISPAEVDVGEEVAITVMITNAGGELGSYEASLNINGEVETPAAGDIAAGGSQRVSFTTSKDVAGTYMVDIGGLTNSFVVKEVAPGAPPAPPAPEEVPLAAPPEAERPVNWPMVWGIIAAVIGGAIAGAIRIRRRIA